MDPKSLVPVATFIELLNFMKFHPYFRFCPISFSIKFQSHLFGRNFPSHLVC